MYPAQDLSRAGARFPTCSAKHERDLDRLGLAFESETYLFTFDGAREARRACVGQDGQAVD